MTPIHLETEDLAQKTFGDMMIAFDPAVNPVVPLGTEMIFQ
jgi:hypothetical protein